MSGPASATMALCSRPSTPRSAPPARWPERPALTEWLHFHNSIERVPKEAQEKQLATLKGEASIEAIEHARKYQGGEQLSRS
jgi:hypothetical protein